MDSQPFSVIVCSAAQRNDELWEEQLATIRAAGAAFDPTSRNWRLTLDPRRPQSMATALAHLFIAAQKYNTTVVVLDPVSGRPGFADDLDEHTDDSTASAV